MRKSFFIVAITLVTCVSRAEVVEVEYDKHMAGKAWQPGKIVHSFRAPIPFTEWDEKDSAESQSLKLFPAYKESFREVENNDTLVNEKDEQHVFVARSTFVIDKAPAQINVSRLVSLEALKQADPQIEQTVISPNQIYKDRKTGRPAILRPGADWCTVAGSLCVQSKWNYPTTLVGFINAAAIIIKKKDTYNETQSELVTLAAVDPAQVTALQKLANPKVPVVSGVQQSIFYVNQFLRWGKNVVILQADPSNPNQTLATMYVAIALSTKYYDLDKHVPSLAKLAGTLRLTPREFFLGQSIANDTSGKSMMAGLPAYTAGMAESMAKALAQ